MKLPYTLYSNKFAFIFFLFSFSFVYAQEDSDLLDAYEDYTEAAREVVYVHINKSTFIKGETLGFTAYVMDKKDKNPSMLTTNLYVSVEDENNKVLKQKLIRVDNGVASNTFQIDSLFSSGYYNIKAYTNWMLNFNEKNYYSESIRVIDPDNEEYIEEEIVDNTIDAQFLPESGHLLNGIINNVGVVIKDNKGFGVPNAKGEVVGNNNEVLTSFETNQFGIGKFPLLAELGNNYKINITHANKDFSFNLGHTVEKNGVIISVKKLKTKFFASVITNPETLGMIKDKRYTLMIHNGDAYDIMDIYFNDDTIVTKAIEFGSIPAGTNILTLFNEDEKPIAERLFFNYEGIDLITSNDVSATRKGNTLTINLNYKDISPQEFNSLSVSVLPEETESYNRHNNIISHTFLQPYIKGTIEKSKYYFYAVDEKKQYELDNLLITQGWSSYSWNDIFENEFNENYTFEQGIRLKANLSSKDIKNNSENAYLMYAISEEEPRIFETKANDNSFIVENLFPVETNYINFSKMTNANGLIPASLYIQSFPGSIPYLNTETNPLNPKLDYKISESLSDSNTIISNSLEDVQKLEEVVVMSRVDRKRQRIEKLEVGRFGNIAVVDEEDRLLYNTLANLLRAKNYNVVESGGTFIITDRLGTNSKPGTGGARPTVPTLYLDDMQISDLTIFSNYSLTNVDYVEINRLGFGEGVRGAGGTIRIYSNSKISKSFNNWDTVQKFDLPLVFSAEKKFYAPKYSNTGDAFYKTYGVIDWKPHLKVDENGNLMIEINRPRIPVTLYIEGIANEGAFIVEEKSISLN